MAFVFARRTKAFISQVRFGHGVQGGIIERVARGGVGLGEFGVGGGQTQRSRQLVNRTRQLFSPFLQLGVEGSNSRGCFGEERGAVLVGGFGVSGGGVARRSLTRILFILLVGLTRTWKWPGLMIDVVVGRVGVVVVGVGG